MQILITFNCVSCIEKTKIKNKDARNGQIFKQHPPISKTICENHFFCKSSYLVHKSFTYLVPMFITVLCRQHIYSLNLHLLPFMPLSEAHCHKTLNCVLLIVNLKQRRRRCYCLSALFFKNMGQCGTLFVYFRPFLNTMTTIVHNLTLIVSVVCLGFKFGTARW